jgi:helix-turn-helix protein
MLCVRAGKHRAASAKTEGNAVSKQNRRPWHRGSIFGDGPRRPLNREQRARHKFLLTDHRRAGRLNGNQYLVGEALLKCHSPEGRCDPSHETLAKRVGCKARTVRRALQRLRELGLVIWQNRIVRLGRWAVAQTSNAYLLLLPERKIGGIPSDGQDGRETRSLKRDLLPSIPPKTEIVAASAALALRKRQIEAALLQRKAQSPQYGRGI